jgi:hypothetical protein
MQAIFNSDMAYHKQKFCIEDVEINNSVFH